MPRVKKGLTQLLTSTVAGREGGHQGLGNRSAGAALAACLLAAPGRPGEKLQPSDKLENCNLWSSVFC